MFDPEADANAEQLIKEYRRVIAFLEQNRPSLEARELNIEATISQLKSELASLEKICTETDQAQQGFLQATADLADKQRELFSQTSKLVDNLLEVSPLDAHVQELAEQRDELKKQFPKE
jgi:chromosome segregation ATPase